MESKDLQVKIESEGGSLTLTPMGLLQHFLPGATPLPNNPRVFVGHPPGQSRNVYVQVEALAGMLLEAREKHINPISGMYLIASNQPDKPAGHKIKYDVRIERARKIPGFLGNNMGLLVKQKDGTIIERSGEVAYPGDTIWGAWAEVYIVGLPRPLRKEVPASVKGSSQSWKDDEGFMYCKVAIDRVLRMNFPSLYANETALPEEEAGSGDIILEPTEQGSFAQPATPVTPSFEFLPDTFYVGSLSTYVPREGRTPGRIALTTEHGDLCCFFWSRPEAIKEAETPQTLIGQPCRMSFEVKPDKTGKAYWYVKTLEFAPAPAKDEPQEDEAA